MKLAELTWPQVDDLPRDMVVVIPTGSLEQHGDHLPLFTDSILVTAVAEAAEQRLANQLLLAPTLWLGASQHHLAFPGSLSASFEGYHAALIEVIECLARHRFQKFFVLNGHGGNTEPNGIALREIKRHHPNLIVGHAGYFAFVENLVAETLTGSVKEMRHACEAETSLMLHVRPDLVRTDRLRVDGLATDPEVKGLIWAFDETTERGSFGESIHATAEKGKLLFEAAVEGVVANLAKLAAGVRLVGKPQV